MELFEHQKEALHIAEGKNRVAFFHDMGLGKTFTGTEKLKELDEEVNLIVCQKSKVDDWIAHFDMYYHGCVFDLTDNAVLEGFISLAENATNLAGPIAGIINYDLIFRRPELKQLKDFTLMLDESSMIQNETAKRSKFILGLQPKNVILLSGTPTGGKYERLYSQLKLLGYPASKTTFWNQYVNYTVDTSQGFPLIKVLGYKNVDRLKDKMDKLGCQFLKTNEVFDLPEQIFTTIKVNPPKQYNGFRKNAICTVEGVELVGDTVLKKMLYERQLCGMYNPEKLSAFRDILESTNDRLIVFYNFTEELRKMQEICAEFDCQVSIVNGTTKDLTAYENESDSVTFLQYQSGAMGLNLQKANKIVYFTPPLSSELFEQSKKRTHRIGQKQTCFYYYLKAAGSVEDRIYKALAMRRDFTERLFEK